MPGSYNAFETLAVSSAAVGFTRTTYGNARNAFGTVEGNSIRYRIDGTDPTAAVGHLAPVGAVIHLTSKDQLVKFRAIATGADATLTGSFGY